MFGFSVVLAFIFVRARLGEKNRLSDLYLSRFHIYIVNQFLKIHKKKVIKNERKIVS